MKLFHIIAASILLLAGCSDNDIKIPKITSTQYELVCENNSPLIYIKAVNAAGSFTFTPPGETQPTTYPVEKLNEVIDIILEENPTLLETLLNISYVEFISDRNVRVHYDGKLLPDQITEDGMFAKSTKMLFGYDNISVSLSQKLSTYLEIPIFGTIPPKYDLSYSEENGRMVVYMKYSALKYYTSEFLSAFSVDKEILDMLSKLVGQFSKVDDTLEVGLYLNKIK